MRVQKSNQATLYIQNTVGNNDNHIKFVTSTRNWDLGQNLWGHGIDKFMLMDTISTGGTGAASGVRLLVDTSGNVGIGTISPSTRLEVAGSIVSTGASTITPTGTTQAIDFLTSNTQTVNLGSATGTVTLTFSGGGNGGVYTVILAQGATPRSVTWPDSVKWEDGTPVTLSGANATDIITLLYNGTHYFAVASKNFL